LTTRLEVYLSWCIVQKRITENDKIGILKVTEALKWLAIIYRDGANFIAFKIVMVVKIWLFV